MKQVQKRGAKYTATVRLNGHSLSATFPRKTQANEWATRVDMAIRDEIANPNKIFRRENFLAKKPKPAPKPKVETGIWLLDGVPDMSWTLRQAIKKYLYEEAPKLRGEKQAILRLKAWDRSEFASMKLTDITAQAIFSWMKNRRKIVNGKSIPVSPSTIRNDIYRLSAIFEIARAPVTKNGWGLTAIKNPTRDIALPTPDAGRDIRLQKGDEQRLAAALMTLNEHGEEVLAFMRIALDTGMRKSEILTTTVADIQHTTQGFAIRKALTKNGSPRTIYLSDRAADIAQRLAYGKNPRQRLFSMKSTMLDNTWRAARAKAGLDDLRIHDLRHEAISRMADAGMSIGALSKMSGHKTAQMLLRYVNAREDDIRAKLSSIAA
ncbi:site-specific integrase [Gluconacetobacter tumulicola]|uniref:Site-specific integrase n=1 Tax=Gluconacetobacter tumulicola TaxID=1017177 RepID=A0A7W4P7F7_9PROT|nr:site-specific integrase [Gluconacetobacter tumulicola]MBB2179909.1 site-specific integrase [Gluconacetobacter tumulicola]